MKVLVTGSFGQVGQELMALSAQYGIDAIGVDLAQLDITDRDAVRNAVQKHQPDVVINAAAYTAVDKAEEDIEAAFTVNRDGPKNLAMVCAAFDIPLIHYSTDYVFDGSKAGAYEENDSVAPLGIYGESKLAGEKAVAANCSKYLILRTSWVFSAHGNNFVKTMLRLGVEREALSIVSDQFGKPTAAGEIARITLAILPGAEGKWGTYHLAQPESTSWHGFAAAIFGKARSQGIQLKVGDINPINTSDYPTPATRPANSELNCARLESTFGIRIKPWRESLVEVIREIGNVRCKTEDVR